MTPPPFDTTAYVKLLAEVNGLDIRPEWRQGVAEHMATTARLAALILAAPMDDRVEPAPVFEA